jgi:site-specific DNA-methyltransferase (adenine-specific)
VSLPTPYYSDDAVTIYHGDCREIAAELGNSFAVITDPPYGISFNTDMTRFSGGNFGPSRGRDWVAPVVGDDGPFDPSPWLEYPAAVLWGGNHFGLRGGTWLVWLKRPPERYGTFLSDAEVAFMKGGHGVYAMYRPWDGCANKRGVNASAHPTQKPVEVMRWSIERGAKDFTILDPFMGSGTTLRAAKDLGRKAIGIEIEERYCEIAAKRMRQEVLL